jgi:predicted short-subunit dehydrogenase-like oxidoreductase (DUF2520 family)
VSAPSRGRRARFRAAPRITIVGRGKVGTALASAATARGHDVALVGSRTLRGLARADLFVLAVADGAVLDVARRVATAPITPAAMVHTSGLLEPDHLAPLRAAGWSVGQAHPLLSFASPRSAVLEGATVLLGGDRLALRRGRALASALGLRAFVDDRLDRASWHAVAALVANGAAALAALGAARWEAGGVPGPVASRALASLLASVAANVQLVGAARALSGPVRRGDPAAVSRHLAALGPAAANLGGARAPRADLVHAALVLAQTPLARELGEAPGSAFDAIDTLARIVLAEGVPPEPRRSKQEFVASRRKSP